MRFRLKPLAALILITGLALAPLPAFAGGEPVDEVDGRAHLSFIEGILGGNGEACFMLGFYTPWGEKPPDDIFSLYWQLTFTIGNDMSTVGWETHDGVQTYLGSPGTSAYILDTGALLACTGIMPTTPFEVQASAAFASWLDEATTTAVSDSTSMRTSSDFIETGDPFTAFGRPVYNLATAKMMMDGAATGPITTTLEATTTSEATTTTAASSTGTDGGTRPPDAIIVDDTGGLSPLWVTFFLILALGVFYFLIVYFFRWWVPPWDFLPRPSGPRYAYRVGVDLDDRVTKEAKRQRDEAKEGDGTGTDGTRRDGTDTEGTGTKPKGTGTTAGDDGGPDGDAPAVFDERKEPKPDCQPLWIECHRLREEEARFEMEADRLRKDLAEAEAECARAKQRVTELEARVADLDQREDAPQRYQRLVEAQQALRDAQDRVPEACDKVEPLVSALQEEEGRLAEAKRAADEACRKAEECEKQQ